MKLLVNAIDVIHDIAVHISGHGAYKNHGDYGKADQEDGGVHDNPPVKRAVGKDASDIIGIKGFEHAEGILAVDGSVESLWLFCDVFEIDANLPDIFVYAV